MQLSRILNIIEQENSRLSTVELNFEDVQYFSFDNANPAEVLWRTTSLLLKYVHMKMFLMLMLFSITIGLRII